MELREKILYLLEHYNQMRAEIDTLKYELAHLSQLEDSEVIEAMTFTVSTGEHVTAGKTSDKTTGIALNYQDRKAQLQKDAVNEITGRLAYLTTMVERLDFYIGKLPALDSAILREHYFEKYSWRELQELKGISTKTLLRHRDEAVKRLVALYEPLARMGLLTDL